MRPKKKGQMFKYKGGGVLVRGLTARTAPNLNESVSEMGCSVTQLQSLLLRWLSYKISRAPEFQTSQGYNETSTENQTGPNRAKHIAVCRAAPKQKQQKQNYRNFKETLQFH